MAIDTNNTTAPDPTEVFEQFKPDSNNDGDTVTPKQAPETPPPAPGGT